MDVFCTISFVYVALMWSTFVLDNLIFLVTRLLKKEIRKESKYAFCDAFMQRGKDTELLMAILNVVAHIGFAILIVNWKIS